jgi:hypothetical protein
MEGGDQRNLAINGSRASNLRNPLNRSKRSVRQSARQKICCAGNSATGSQRQGQQWEKERENSLESNSKTVLVHEEKMDL